MLVGGSIGGFIGLWPGGFGTMGLVAVFDIGSGGLEDLVWGVIGAGIGAWIGAVAGAYLLMRWSGHSHRKETTIWLSVLIPLLVGAGAWIAVSGTDSDVFGSGWLPYTVFVLSVIATAYLARRFGTAASQPSERSQI